MGAFRTLLVPVKRPPVMTRITGSPSHETPLDCGSLLFLGGGLSSSPRPRTEVTESSTRGRSVGRGSPGSAGLNPQLQQKEVWVWGFPEFSELCACACAMQRARPVFPGKPRRWLLLPLGIRGRGWGPGTSCSCWSRIRAKSVPLLSERLVSHVRDTGTVHGDAVTLPPLLWAPCMC